MAGIRTGKMFKLDDEEKTGLLGGLVLLMFGIIISLLLAYAHKQSIEQNATSRQKLYVFRLTRTATYKR